MEGLQAGSGGLEHLRLETGQEAQMPRWSREHYGGDAEERADPRDEQGVGQRAVALVDWPPHVHPSIRFPQTRMRSFSPLELRGRNEHSWL